MGATPGRIGASQISGSLDAKNIVMGVLHKAVEFSNLEVLCGKTPVPELTATIPVATAGAVTEDLEEYEASDIEGAAFTNIDFSLKKDRVKFSVSDEAGYKSKVGDPLGIQQQGAAVRLGATLDKKVVTAMETSPQTGATAAAWSTVGNNPLIDLGAAVTAILPYKANFVIMPKNVYAKYIGNDFIKTMGTGNPGAMKGAIGKVPGVDLDIYVDDNVTAKSVIVGATNGYPAVIGNGPVKVRDWDDPNAGAKMYQMDVFRQVKAPIFLNSSSLNMAVRVVTAVIA